jgi:hypothetical protein
LRGKLAELEKRGRAGEGDFSGSGREWQIERKGVETEEEEGRGAVFCGLLFVMAVCIMDS